MDVFYQYISDALPVMLYIFLITAFLDGVYLLPVLDTCADVVALMIMTSPGPSPGLGRYNWYQSPGSHTVDWGLKHGPSARSTSVPHHPIVIRKFTD